MRRARLPRMREARTRRCRGTSLGAAAPSKEEDKRLPDEGPMARRLVEPAIHRAPAPPAPPGPRHSACGADRGQAAGLVGLSKSLTGFAVASKENLACCSYV